MIKNQLNINPCLRVGMISIAFILSIALAVYSQAAASHLQFEISFSPEIQKQPVTGRMFLIIATDDSREPRLQIGGWKNGPPLFGVDVNQLEPGASVLIDDSVLGYPLRSLAEIPAGDYYVQALFNVYTEFHRADGHTIWAHMDQWEGQHFNRSPGNFISKVEKMHLDPAKGKSIKLKLTQVLPPVDIPEDTPWVKRIKIKSELLTKFWGHPIYLGATVLLPKGYDTHRDVYYPVEYVQGHFHLSTPHGFSTKKSVISKERRQKLLANHDETDYDFYQAWNSDNFPRMISVTFQHPTPYYDDSYAVNSANNGPYGDAIMQELIPYIENHFRIIQKPYARVISGGSTGGWEALALQVYHPDFFGGAWVFYPDPVDFRQWGLVNIYEDDNAFFLKAGKWRTVDRPMHRTVKGQPENTIREVSWFERVLGSHCRSGQQLAIWEATYGPVGEDGYPKPLWDPATGKIDHTVSSYMKKHGYDLRSYLETHWSTIGAKLQGKLRFYCGDMDNWYLNLGVYRLQDFLEHTQDPYYDGSFEYGRPMKKHGWQPMPDSELIRMMAQHILSRTPREESPVKWEYN